MCRKKLTCKPDSVFVWSSILGRRCRRPHAASPDAAVCRLRCRLLRPLGGQPRPAPCRPCSRWGLPGASVSRRPVRSYRTISPLPRTDARRYVSVALSVGSPRPAVSRHHCPAESGLSSTPVGAATTRRASSDRRLYQTLPRLPRREELREDDDWLQQRILAPPASGSGGGSFLGCSVANLKLPAYFTDNRG